jgi:RHS repeat-associated protein
VTDPIGQVRRFNRDAVGRLLETIEPSGNHIGFTYDAADNVTSILPPGRPPHSFAYSAGGERLSWTLPALSGASDIVGLTYGLDADATGMSVGGVEAMRVVTDAAGRTASRTHDLDTITYDYDPSTGFLNGMTTEHGVVTQYAYSRGRPSTTSWRIRDDFHASVSRTFLRGEVVLEERVNFADRIAFEFDPDGLLTKAGALLVSRNASNGWIEGTTIGQVTDARVHSAFGEWEAYEATAAGVPIGTILFQRDKLGRIVQKTVTSAGTTNIFQFVYDPSGRLSQVSRNGAVATIYAYDPNGNRVSRDVMGAQETGRVDDRDRLLAWGGLRFDYTPDGRLLRRMDDAAGTVTSYVYDIQGNLREVLLPNGRKIEYLVDGVDRRVETRIDGQVQSRLIYRTTLQPVAEMDAQGAVVARFVYGTGTNAPDYLLKGGKVYRLIKDEVGSVWMVVDADTGVIAQQMTYDEFGRVITDTAPGFQPFGFAGGLYTPETGLVRLGARDYDAQIGRWTTPDRLGFYGGDTNLFAYAANDPVNYVDPRGTRIQSNFTITDEEIPGDDIPKKSDALTQLWRRDVKVPGQCSQAADGSWGFDVSINFDAWYEFRSEADKSEPSKESKGLTLQQHEQLHMNDYATACTAENINKRIKTDKFKDKSRCERALKNFEKTLNRDHDWIRDETTRRRDKQGIIE